MYLIRLEFNGKEKEKYEFCSSELTTDFLQRLFVFTTISYFIITLSL